MINTDPSTVTDCEAQLATLDRLERVVPIMREHLLHRKLFMTATRCVDEYLTTEDHSPMHREEV